MIYPVKKFNRFKICKGGLPLIEVMVVFMAAAEFSYKEHWRCICRMKNLQ